MTWQINKQRLKSNAPHQALIAIKLEIIEMNSAGLMIGAISARDSLLCTLTGRDFQTCLKKADRFKEAVANVCKNINDCIEDEE